LIKSTEIRKKLESQNQQSDIILVKGLKTGSIKVHISINEKGYEVISKYLFLSLNFILYFNYSTSQTLYL